MDANAENDAGRRFVRLEEEDLRRVWGREAQDFTPWLAEQEWLDMLGECIGVEMDSPREEVKASQSDRRCDIVAKTKREDDGEQETVVIENQLEATDFSHLGRILLYAATQGAKHAVWVVKDATPDHRRTIAWLNRNTTSDIGFYLVRISAYRLEDNRVFPVFTLLEEPDTEGKLERSGTTGQKRNFDFWTGFINYATNNGKGSRVAGIKSFQQPNRFNSYTVRIGSGKCHIHLWNSNGRADISVRASDGATLDRMLPHKDEMAKAVGASESQTKVNVDNAHPVIRFEGPCDTDNEKGWPAAYKWYAESLSALAPVVRRALGVKG